MNIRILAALGVVILGIAGFFVYSHQPVAPDARLTTTTFLIDHRGPIVCTCPGEPDFDALHTLLERLLAEPV
ncbi:MAG: hypothetical protein Q7J47_02075 [Azoarcus sp.]|nr:hypothetical protein [Azoarcus sp.]